MPPYFPMGVRNASITNTSFIEDFFLYFRGQKYQFDRHDSANTNHMASAWNGLLSTIIIFSVLGNYGGWGFAREREKMGGKAPFFFLVFFLWCFLTTPF